MMWRRTDRDEEVSRYYAIRHWILRALHVRPKFKMELEDGCPRCNAPLVVHGDMWLCDWFDYHVLPDSARVSTTGRPGETPCIHDWYYSCGNQQAGIWPGLDELLTAHGKELSGETAGDCGNLWLLLYGGKK